MLPCADQAENYHGGTWRSSTDFLVRRAMLFIKMIAETFASLDSFYKPLSNLWVLPKWQVTAVSSAPWNLPW